MIVKVFAIHDVKAEAYMSPFFMPAVGLALRAFKDLVGDEKSQISKHPSDYTLYLVGEFDDGSGVLSGVGPTRLASGVEMVGVTPLSVKAVS